MKKFIFRLLLATLIGFTIYFFISGNSFSDVFGEDGPISRSGFTELRDQVLGSFSTEDKSFSFDDVLPVGTSTSSDTESNSGDDGPLSKLLGQFRSSSDNETESDPESQSDREDISEADINAIEESTNLPDFSFICFPEMKRECGFEGCDQSNPDVNFVLINPDDSLIHQCSLDTCTSHEFKGRQYSDSYNYQIQSNDDVFMLSRELDPDSTGRTAYAVIRTRGVNTEINLGRCLGQ